RRSLGSALGPPGGASCPAPGVGHQFRSKRSARTSNSLCVCVCAVSCSSALALHERAVEHAGCHKAEGHPDDAGFMARQCPWRWRCLLMVSAELGHHLAVGLRDLPRAAGALRRTSRLLASVGALPFFRHHDTASPLRLNQNRDFFPAASHWPVWSRPSWPPFACFLEEHHATFRSALEELLAADPAGEVFRAVGLQQGDRLAREPEDWSRVDLVNSGGMTDWCGLTPWLRRSCELLATRSEINSRCETYLAGAALARLLPGAELRPHFDTNPRLAAHLGLRTPPGAHMVVADEVVVWEEGRAVVFDDTYVHRVQHDGAEPRYLLVAWMCHPCDLGWRAGLGAAWAAENPLPKECGGGGGAPPAGGGFGLGGGERAAAA
ncbi:unnamed protein product, partial [Prorocentrum cordatum]